MSLSALIVSILACFAVVGGALYAIRRRARSNALPVTADWIDELSLDRYRPMLRLLDEGDLREMRQQPGFTPDMAAALRRQRCQIFRGYLRSLHSDFSRVILALKLVMMQAAEDRPDLAAMLVRTQLQFACGEALVQAQLALYSCGIGTVDIKSLLSLFDGMRLQLRTLVPASASASA